MGEYSDIMGDFTAADVTPPGDGDTVDTTDFNIPDVAQAGGSPDDEALVDAANSGSLFPEEGSGMAVDFGTLGNLGTQSVQSVLARGLVGPGGYLYDTGSGASTQGTSRQLVPVRGGGDVRLKTILLAAAARLGKHIALKGIVHLIKKWGLPAAAGAFGLGADDLLYILARYEVRPRRGARGPHLRTVVRRIRQGHHYEHLLAKYAAKAHVRRHYAPMYRAPPRRRRYHHKRRK